MYDENFDAFDLSPVPPPGPDATPPEIFRGIYGMPLFVTVPTDDLAASTDFWIRGLGFVDLFSAPGAFTHLRRWAFQDVLLVPGEVGPSAVTVSVACVLGQLEGIVAACESVRSGSTSAPVHTPWNTVDVTVTTPEGARIVLTAARPYEAGSAEAASLADIGIAPNG